MSGSLRTYLEDPFLGRLWQRIRAAGPIRSVSLDITHRCNLRCTGCYYFEEGMDRFHTAEAEAALDRWIERERARGTNFVTIVGGEPSLVLHRLEKLYAHFRLSVATNGLRRIPFEGFEELPIGISLWGNADTDRQLRGSGKVDVFRKALDNYRNDERAFWYYTVAPGLAHEVEEVVARCIDNGNRVLFNYYSDLAGKGGALDYRQGFERVREVIDRLIDRYPDRILTTAWFNQVVTSGRLFDQQWGYEVCTNLSTNYAPNAERLKNGQPYNRHFRAYNADFETVRRCCTGIDRDCASCFDTWEHFSWIMIHMKKHMANVHYFTCWLATMYMFYFITRLVPRDEGAALLPELHRRVKTAMQAAGAPVPT